MRSRALRLFAALTATTLTIAMTALPAGTGGGQEAAGAKPSAPVPPRALTAHLIGHAHIDLSWLWRWEETVADIARYTFRGTLAQMDKMPGLTFAQSQAAIYEAIEKDQPELFAAIARKIKEGTWVPVGGMWVEPDANMPDGEALARQLLYGKRYFLDTFGIDVKVGWNPDTFGHSWQLPQILRRAGIDSYVFGRCAPGPDPTHFFWWEGLDGSRVLGYVPAGWYNVSLQNGTRPILEAARKNTGIKDFMILYGAGDHGGGPRDVDLAAIRKFREDPNEPRLVFDLPEAYLKGIAAANGAGLPLVKRELNFTFPACYTTQTATKKNNRQLESLLVTAEKFSAIATASGYRDYYPERDLDEAWKIVLRNQFHDILDGSSIGPVYDEVAGFYRQARTRGERALDFSLETISNAIDTRGEGFPVVVYNPLFWERTEPVIVEVTVPPDTKTGKPWEGTIRMRAEGERPIRAQILERRVQGDRVSLSVLFMAEGVPSLGYKVFRAVPVLALSDERASVDSDEGLIARERAWSQVTGSDLPSPLYELENSYRRSASTRRPAGSRAFTTRRPSERSWPAPGMSSRRSRMSPRRCRRGSSASRARPAGPERLERRSSSSKRARCAPSSASGPAFATRSSSRT